VRKGKLRYAWLRFLERKWGTSRYSGTMKWRYRLPRTHECDRSRIAANIAKLPELLRQPHARGPGGSPSRFVFKTRLPAKIRRLAEIRGLALVLNSQAPRLASRIFHGACGKAERIRVVLVNLSTHSAGALYQTGMPASARYCYWTRGEPVWDGYRGVWTYPGVRAVNR
jgi:hypothetical protein